MLPRGISCFIMARFPVTCDDAGTAGRIVLAHMSVMLRSCAMQSWRDAPDYALRHVSMNSKAATSQRKFVERAIICMRAFLHPSKVLGSRLSPRVVSTIHKTSFFFCVRGLMQPWSNFVGNISHGTLGTTPEYSMQRISTCKSVPAHCS